MAKTKDNLWSLTDHACRKCGGRVMQYSGTGLITGGGNPLYQCADCGNASSAMGPSVICWCGYQHPQGGSHGAQVYECVPRANQEQIPWLAEAFASNGYFPDGRWTIGVVSTAGALIVQKRWESLHPNGQDPLIAPLEDVLARIKTLEDKDPSVKLADAQRTALTAGAIIRRVLTDLRARGGK